MVPERLSMVPERMSMVPERLRETIRPSWSSCSDFLAFSAHRRLYARRFLIGSAQRCGGDKEKGFYDVKRNMIVQDFSR